MVKVLAVMIESKFTFLQMQVNRLFVNPPESGKPGFRIASETFNPVHMGAASHKFLSSMMDAEVFAVPHIDQPIIPSPPIPINHTI